MALSVTILTDDQVHRGEGLLAEHGLSLLVETEGSKVLLDAGQSDVCRKNAACLDTDLSDLDTIVLSHGHYDHGDGLPSLVEEVERPEVIAHPEAFSSRFVRQAGREDRYVGLGYDAESLARSGARVRLEAGPWEIAQGLVASGHISRVTSFEDGNSQFWMVVNREWCCDRFEDDQALLAHTPEGLVVLLGCAHAGAVDTLRHAMTLTGDDRIRAVVGGFHLAGASSERIEQTAAALREMEVRQVVACHCTGFAARTHLHATFGQRFTNGAVGLRLTF